MSNLAVSLFVLACVFGGGLAGIFLRKVLPQDHLNAAPKSTVNSSQHGSSNTHLSMAQKRTVVLLYFAPALGEIEIEKLPVQVSIGHGRNVVLMQERGANQREREKEESP